jgi:hypothetical protein
VSVRVAPLPLADLEAFLSDEAVADRLRRDDSIPEPRSKRVTFAMGAPGRLLAGEALTEARLSARRMLEAASGRNEARYEAAWLTSSTKARGGFADTLDALTVELHAQAESKIRGGDSHAAFAASKAIDAVEVAKERILTNVSPQLITVNLLRELRELLS